MGPLGAVVEMSVGRLGLAACAAMVMPFLWLGAADYGLQLRVRARPTILLWGGDVRVECLVPRSRVNRTVEWGLSCPNFYRSSQESAGRVIYETLTNVPVSECGTCEAFCSVDLHDNLGRVTATPAAVLVKGPQCDEAP